VALIVLDASVVIAQRDSSDAHHSAARKALAEVAAEDLRLPASTYSEALVGPARRGTLRRARADIEAFGLQVEPISPEIAEEAARLRGSHRTLRFPDALVLACADVLKADVVLTADASWRRYSRRVSVIGPR
jgi:predicted nucleic acid-binding protein